jgi:hypothetical protein
MYACMCAYASGVAGVGVVKHTLAEPEGCWPDVRSIVAYLCDVVLNDVLCDTLHDVHALAANRRQIVCGGLYLLANGILCPLLLIFFV